MKGVVEEIEHPQANVAGPDYWNVNDVVIACRHYAKSTKYCSRDWHYCWLTINLWLLFKLALKSEVHILPHFILNPYNGSPRLHSSSVTVYYLNIYKPGMIQHFALECIEDQSSTVLTYPLHVID